MCNPIVNLGLTVHPTFLSLDLLIITVIDDYASENPVTHQLCNFLLGKIRSFSDESSLPLVFVTALEE